MTSMETSEQQIQRLGHFIMDEIPGEPSQSEGAVDTAIRLLKKTLITESDSNLIAHAKRELEMIGEEPAFIEGYLKMIQIFADMGHSGGSASIFIPTLNALLQYKNLKPLTNDPKEWNDVGNVTWQNSRNPEAFSEDDGKTYYLLSDRDRHKGPLPYYKSEDMIVKENDDQNN